MITFEMTPFGWVSLFMFVIALVLLVFALYTTNTFRKGVVKHGA